MTGRASRQPRPRTGQIALRGSSLRVTELGRISGVEGERVEGAKSQELDGSLAQLPVLSTVRLFDPSTSRAVLFFAAISPIAPDRWPPTSLPAPTLSTSSGRWATLPSFRRR